MQRVHFEEYHPRDFERLVFAYLLRTDRWQSLEWYGQVGSDLGRDIWGVRDRDERPKRKVCIQCANRRTVPFKKVAGDINNALSGPNGIPDEFLLVTGGTVGATLRDKIKKHAASKGVGVCEIWSGPEFEERLRSNAESLLKRFVEGEHFPDSPKEIEVLVQTITAKQGGYTSRVSDPQNPPPKPGGPPQAGPRAPVALDADQIRVLQVGARWRDRLINAITVSVELRINDVKARVLLRRLHTAGLLESRGNDSYRLSLRGEEFLVDRGLL